VASLHLTKLLGKGGPVVRVFFEVVYYSFLLHPDEGRKAVTVYRRISLEQNNLEVRLA
jgi:hypothetical protein